MEPARVCPWDGWERANLAFCELDRCAWVTQPANTWSNIGFFVVALVLAHRVKRDGATRARWLAPIALMTGVASSAFHATGTLAGQELDQGVMLFESALFIVLNIGRWRALPPRTLAGLYAGIVGFSVGALLLLPRTGVMLFTAHVIVFLAIEAALALRSPRPTYGPLLMVGALFVASYALWWGDKLGVLCDPENHIFNGHAAWHLLGAASFYFWYRHYAQFR